MTEAYENRRHADGSIDFDFYRARSRALRSQAMRDALQLTAAAKVALISAAAVVTAAAIAVTPTQAG
jgi:hypothetical protein